MRFKAMKRMAAGLALGPLTLAQQKPAATVEINPLAHDEQAIGQGREIYNRTCTVCHGLDGPAEDRDWSPGRSHVLRTDEAIFGAIQKGIPGTEMPASGLQRRPFASRALPRCARTRGTRDGARLIRRVPVTSLQRLETLHFEKEESLSTSPE